MPPRYEKMRDSFKAQGMSDKAAKGKAARLYNATRGEGSPPVTRNSEKTARSLQSLVSRSPRK